MKRLGLTLVAALCLAATTFAAGNQPTTAKWEGNICLLYTSDAADE